jgi:antitoxin component of MazEF toxin-antitoxin module
MEMIGNALQRFDRPRRCNYRYYMKPVELKVARIGNSRGVRIPAATLARYHIGATVVMEERSDGILLRPLGSPDLKLSWEETAREMARTAEDWSDWDLVDTDGLDTAPWGPGRVRRVAEDKADYRGRRRSRKP